MMEIKIGSQNKNIKRINEIYRVLKKNDFGYLIEESTFFKTFPFLRNRKLEKQFESEDKSVPIRIRKVLEELGPAYIKLGQMISTRPDLVGNDIATELQKLRDDAPAAPFNEIKELLEEEFNQPIDEIYTDIDETPLGSASIGQVYKGKLKKTGEEVAIKVQKPGSREYIESDIEIMKFIANNIDKYISRTKSYNLPTIMTEFEKTIFKELNYLEEVRNMENLSKNFRGIFYVHIPEVYEDYCTSRVITMELINGIELSELIENDYPEYNKKKIAQYGVKSYFKQIMIDGFFHADPHPGNIIITKDNKLCYIDVGMVGILDEDFKQNLAQLILLLINGNASSIINQLIYMDIITKAQNTSELNEDINDLIKNYYGAELKSMDGLVESLINVMIKHEVVLPREFIMIGRGITLIEDSGKKLDPNFNTSTELKKLSKRMIVHKFSPDNIIKNGISYFLQIEHLAKDLPDTINNTLSKLEEGEISVNLKIDGLMDLTKQLSIAIILSAMIISSGLAILADEGPMLLDMPVFGLIGFVFSAVLGGYLVILFLMERHQLK